MHVSFCCYSTIGIPNFKTLTGTYERGYTYILLLITKYVYKFYKHYKLCGMLRLASDVFSRLMLYS